MARSLWKGAISFGLVHIAAVRDEAPELTMLDRRDFSPVGYQRYNKSTKREVEWADIVKGYEYKDGEYVVLTEEDLRQANVEATQTIDILAFVDAAELPPLYFDQPYYLAPGKGGDKVYALLRETLRRSGKAGIATVVIRVKQHLAALLCMDDAIVLHTLRYSQQIRDPDALALPAKSAKGTAPTDRELKMAAALVEGMSEPWKPEQYRDQYRDDLLALVERKAKAGQAKTLTPEVRHKASAGGADVIDLVALLQQSLGGKGGARKASTGNSDEGRDATRPKGGKRPRAKPAGRAPSVARRA